MINLVGPSYESSLVKLSSQRLINWQLRTAEEGSGAKALVVAECTPGATAQLTVTANGPCRGTFLAASGPAPEKSPRLYGVWGSKVVRFNLDMTGYDFIGEVTGTNPVSMTANAFNFVLCDGLGVYTRLLDEPDGSATQIKPVALPPKPGITPEVPITPTHVGCLAQRVIVNSGLGGATWFFSEFPDAADPSTIVFPASNVYTAESSTDVIQALTVVKGSLLVLGTRSFEVWGTNNNKFDPYSTTGGSAAAIGTEAPYSLAVTGDQAFFLGSSDTGSAGVYSLVGTEAVRISDQALEDQIMELGFSAQRGAIGWAYSWKGQTFYVLDFPVANRTWVWGSSTKAWAERLKRSIASGDWLSYSYRYGQYHLGRIWVGTNSDGALCYLDDQKFTEHDGTAIVRQRISPVIWDELNYIQARELTVDCEVGTTPYLSGIYAEPVMVLEISKDGGYSYGNFKRKSLGKQGQYRKVVRWNSMGYQKSWTFRLTYSAPASCTLLLARFDYSLGGRT
jgi:hypothetical protein